MSGLTDRELATMAAGGDQQAFAQLVERYQKPVYNLALRMSGSADDAFDLAQEAFLRAWKGLPNFHFESSFSTWLYRLASNVCLDYLRSLKRSKTVSLRFLEEDGDLLEYPFPDPAPGPEETAIANVQREAVRELLNALEPEYREALTLCALNGLSYAEIAEIQDVAVGTVKSRISRAREKMRNGLFRIGNNSEKKPSQRKTGKEAGKR